MSGPPALGAFDPGPEIRGSARSQAPLAAGLRRAARALSRGACQGPGGDATASVMRGRLARLRRAMWASPYYCASLSARGLSPNDLRSLSDLAHFPTLDRETLRAVGAQIPALEAHGPGATGLVTDRSSGTTGLPLAIVKDDRDTTHMWACLRFWLGWTGRRLPAAPRVALLCSLPHGVEYRSPIPALHSLATLARIAIPRPEASARLSAFAPHVLFTDPAGLHWLLGQERVPRPLLTLSSALYLAPDLRGRTSERLASPLINYYSLSETGPVAWECLDGSGRFHVMLPDMWVESVTGEVVVTRLRPSVVPLLRYRTGDRGSVSSEACRCGHRGLSITGMDGRRACHFIDPRGRPVDAWNLAWVFQHHTLDAFRLTQTGPITFQLALSGSRDPGVETRLRAALRSLGWNDVRLSVAPLPPGSLASPKPAPWHREWCAGDDRPGWAGLREPLPS